MGRKLRDPGRRRATQVGDGARRQRCRWQKRLHGDGRKKRCCALPMALRAVISRACSWRLMALFFYKRAASGFESHPAVLGDAWLTGGQAIKVH